MKHFKIKGAYITLGQFVKAASLVSSGGMVKPYLEDNKILLNEVEENRRGKKIYPGDILMVNGVSYLFL